MRYAINTEKKTRQAISEREKIEDFGSVFTILQGLRGCGQ